MATLSRGFTLLELLIVVAILAIIGGGILVAYDDLDDQASEGVSAHTMSALDSAVRTYTAVMKSAPDELDAMMAATYAADADPAVPLAGTEKVALLPGKLLGTKTLVHTLTASQLAALNSAGIERLRYVDALGNDPDDPAPDTGDTVTLGAPDADGSPAVVGPLLNIDIPSRVHETPRPGSGRNRGRGFVHTLAVGDTVLRWNPSRSGGGGAYDNEKIGAGPDDVVFVFGLGNDASIVGSAEGRAQLPQAQLYGKVKPERYGRYLLLYNLGPEGAEYGKARLQVVLNTHGDFADEMISEHALQKP